MLELSMALSILGGYLSYVFLGFSPGGIITAGYLALFINQPARIVGTLIVSFLTCFVVRVCANFMILYGRKRFAFTLLVAFLVGWFWDAITIRPFFFGQEVRVIGFIVPGLIANDIEKQGIVGTLSTLTIVLTFVRLGLLLFQFIRMSL